MNPRFKKGVVKQVALWGDVVEVMDGKPYGGLMNLLGLSSKVIYKANQRGYFDEGLTFRIYSATCERLRLTDYGLIESSHQESAKRAQDAE